MTTSQDSAVLSAAECWELLRGNTIGRLAVAVNHHPNIFPVNYAVQDDTLLFRTAPGAKLAALTVRHSVALEIDSYDAAGGWSVVVQGAAQAIEWGEDYLFAQRSELRPWTATIKPIFVRITPSEVTGRRFLFGAEPDYF